MFRPVTARPDFVAQEHELLREWAERRTFARLRAQNAGNARWSFLDGPITANNPMGVHHAWGRTYKDLFQRYHAMLGEDQRYQNGFDCQGLWVEVNVERDLGFRSKRDIEAFGIAEFVSLCKQRVLTYAARQTEQSQRLGYWMDWNDPAELLPPARPAGRGPGTGGDDRGPGGPGDRHGRDARRAPRDARRRRLVLHVQQREQRPDLGLPRGVPPARLDLQGPRLHAVVPALRHGPVADGDERGLRRPRGPGAHRPVPAGRPAGRGAARLDHDARGRWRRTSPRPSARTWRTSGSARAGTCYWVGKGRSSRRSVGPFEVLEQRPGRDLVGWRYTGPFDELPAVGAAFAGQATTAPYEHRVVAWDEVGEEEGTGIVHIAPGCGAEDFQLGKALGLPVIGPIDEDGRYYDGFGWLSRPRGPGGRRVGRLGPRAARLLLPPRAVLAPLPALLAVRDPAAVPARRRVVHQHGPGLRPAAGPADRRPRSTPACATRSWRWSTGSGGSRSFGYERELDWLLNMRDWMISKKRYYGLALPIYDCAACGTVRRHRRARGAAGAGDRGLGRLRGAHAAPAVRGRGQDRVLVVRRRRSRGSPTSATPGWTPGSCRSPRSTTARTPSTGRSGSRPTSCPRASPASSATGSTRCSRCRPCCGARSRSGRSSATRRCSARTAAPCTRAGATRSSSTRPPSAWASTSCAGCMPRRGRTTTSCSAGTRRTRRAASCWSCGTSTRSS